MNPTKEQLRSIIFPQGGKYLYGALSGPARAATRQAVFAAFGVKAPKSQCGLTRTMEMLRDWVKADGKCPADVDHAIVEALQ